MSAPWDGVGLASEDLLRDARAEFLNTYQNTVGQSKYLPSVMRLGIESTKRVERYGYFESPPSLDRWDPHTGMPEEGFLSRSFEVANLNWAKAIPWFEDDLEDNVLGDFREVARRLAIRATQIPEEVFFQILTASSSSRLLKAVPNAPDGAALFAATAGGSARFGVSGGNLLTGAGVASAQDVRGDFWAAIARMRRFQDTEGQPLLENELDQGITIVAAAQNEEVFRETFNQGRTIQIVQEASANVGGAAVTNTILESGLKVTVWLTQRLTDNDWYVFLDSPSVPKAIFEQLRQSPRTIEEDRSNSERARRYKIFSLLIDMRAGYGVGPAYGCLKVNN